MWYHIWMIQVSSVTMISFSRSRPLAAEWPVDCCSCIRIGDKPTKYLMRRQSAMPVEGQPSKHSLLAFNTLQPLPSKRIKQPTVYALGWPLNHTKKRSNCRQSAMAIQSKCNGHPINSHPQILKPPCCLSHKESLPPPTATSLRNTLPPFVLHSFTHSNQSIASRTLSVHSHRAFTLTKQCTGHKMNTHRTLGDS
jgi:hypothetical protein